MKISNVRMGLATNSSSTHSLIFLPPDMKVRTTEYREFGWEFFTAADRKSKQNYLALTLYDNLQRMMGDSNARVIVQSLFKGSDVLEDTSSHDYPNHFIQWAYIDHQSMQLLPANWDGKGVDLGFFEAYKRFILDNPIAILGGNDNTDEGHPLGSSGEPVLIDLPRDSHDLLVARNDGTHWVLFNRSTGAKIRFSFEQTQKPITKALTPELVDIKITDFCPFGCAYCYQGSTHKGKHAEKQVLSSLPSILGGMKVFEVAIGGGEPTLHPDFISMLGNFRYYNIVPNFTTKSLAWLRDEKQRKPILEACGAFAYSVTRATDVHELVKMLHKYDIETDGYSYKPAKATVQYVLECGGDLEGILRAASNAGLRITLLGFKDTGFGKDFKKVSEDWIEIVQKVKEDKSRWLNLGVDTAIIQKYGNEIKSKLGVHDALFTAQEGKFSMYIDAVEKRVAPSSYCAENQYVPFENRKERELIESAFKEW